MIGARTMQSRDTIAIALGADQVINTPKQNIDNRLSRLQRDVLAYLATVGQPQGDRIGHLPRTGEVVDAIGRNRDKASFTAVSRALSRLEKAGLVAAHRPSIATRGKGSHWALQSLAG